jgi:hypothetical protein
MRISAHVHTGTKIYNLRLANIGRLNLYRKHSTIWETVAKIQDKRLATFRSNGRE